VGAKLAPKIHPLEKALLGVVAAHLVFLPWALGTMHVWSQGISFGLSVLSILIALQPRYYDGEYTEGKPFTLHTRPKLLRFPIFWIGLLLFVYILIQALNPAWEYARNDKVWWLQGVSCIDWLPTGMRTPFDQASPWRSLMIYSSAWLTACAVWIGFTRRRCLHALFVVLVVNGVLFALVGLAQKLTGADEMLWCIPARSDYFFATIIYKNHAAAYLNLILMAAFGLALWHSDRAARQMSRSDPSFVILLGALLLFTADLFTNSRMGMVLGAAGLLLGLAAYGIRTLQHREMLGNPLPFLLTAAFLAAFLAIGLSRVDWSKISERYAALWTDDKVTSIESRNVARQATLEMFMDSPLTGWGAGSFRFYFPVYQQRYPKIMTGVPELIQGKAVQRRLSWQYAHNDFVQGLAELGMLGGLLVAGICGFWIYSFSRIRRWVHPVGFSVVAVSALTAVHCWVDFQLHCPANLVTLGFILTAGLSWIVLEERIRA